MKNIHVRRYENPAQVAYAGWIEPEDREWILFIDADGEPSLYRRVEIETGDGTVSHGYANVEVPSTEIAAEDLLDPIPMRSKRRGLTYEVKPFGDGYQALLGERNIATEGATEHEAVQNLLNYVAELCTAGCLDHTGVPIHLPNKKRYEMVYPETKPERPVGK